MKTPKREGPVLISRAGDGLRRLEARRWRTQLARLWRGHGYVAPFPLQLMRLHTAQGWRLTIRD